MKTSLSLIFILIFWMLKAQNVIIPDANFKAYLVGNTGINTNMDTEIQVSEAQAFTGTIDCSYQSITDLTGIEAFDGITFLICSGNQLTSLDVTQNTALTGLSCYQNQLTTLNLIQNTAITDLNCNSNQLIALNLSQNTSLVNLWCNNNQLESLDLSNNTELVYLDCNENQLTSLNVANGNNPNFSVLLVGNNPYLTCIQVDNEVWSTANWTVLVPAGIVFSENCNVGIKEHVPPIVNLLQNPVQTVLKVQANVNVVQIKITSLSGQQHLITEASTINVSRFDAGVYQMEVVTEKGSVFKRFVKQ